MDVSIIINPTTPKQTLPAWLAYGGTLAMWMEKKYLEENPNQLTYQYSYPEELDARQTLLEVWESLKEKDQSLKDSYLDDLEKVKNAKFLSEYVWYFFHRENWGPPPKSLKLSEFKVWLKKNLPNHQSQTLVTAKFDNQ